MTVAKISESQVSLGVSPLSWANDVLAELGFPDASDGARGVAFVESAMRSFASGGVWTGVEAI